MHQLDYKGFDPGRSVSDSPSTSICGSEVAMCEAVSMVSTVSGSELTLGARAVRCDASRLVQAMRVKWAVTVLLSRRSLREISGGNWGSAWEICSCRGGDWRSLFLRCLARHPFTDDPPQRRKMSTRLYGANPRDDGYLFSSYK